MARIFRHIKAMDFLYEEVTFENLEKERDKMRRLNEQLASEMGKVIFLENRNEFLLVEVDRLETENGHKIKEMYEGELMTAREDLESCRKDRGKLNLQIVELRNAWDREKLKVADLEKSIRDYVFMMEKQKNKIAGLVLVEDENKRLKSQLQKLQDNNDRLREDLTEATYAKLEEANRAQTLKEKLEFKIKALMTENEEISRHLKQDSTMHDIRDRYEVTMNNLIVYIRQIYDDELRNFQSKYNSLCTKIEVEFIELLSKKKAESYSINEEKIQIVKSQLKSAQNKLEDFQGQNASLKKQLERKDKKLDAKDEKYKICKLGFDKDKHELQETIAKANLYIQQLIRGQQNLDVEINIYGDLMDKIHRTRPEQQIMIRLEQQGMIRLEQQHMMHWEHQHVLGQEHQHKIALKQQQKIEIYQGMQQDSLVGLVEISGEREGVSPKPIDVIDASTSPAIAEPSIEQSTSPAIAEASIEQSTSPAIDEPSIEQSTSPAIAEPSIEQSTSPAIAEPSIEQSTSPAIAEPSIEQSTSPAIAEPSIEQSTSPAIAEPSIEQSTTVTGEINVRRTRLGKVAFQEFSPEGEFVSIENISSDKAVDLKSWKVLRKDGSGTLHNSFTFGDNIILAAKDILKIYGNTWSNLAHGIDQVLEDQQWSTGSGTFVLIDDKGKEKATMNISFM